MAKTNADFYSRNSDYSGTRRIQADIQELVEYRPNTSVRIWYNEQRDGFANHWHRAIEIILPMENWYDVTVGTDSYHLQPGDILFIPSRALHTLSAPESGVRFIFLLDTAPLEAMRCFPRIEPLLASTLYLTHSSNPALYDEVYHILLQMRNEYFGTNEYSDLSVYSLFLNLIALLGNYRLNSLQLFSSGRVSRQKEYIDKFNRILEYIDAHYMDDLCLDDMAASAGFSKFHFSRLFKQYTGFTFAAYVCHSKIRIAEELLSRPDLSITQIAMQSGFSSLSTFNRVFRQQKNCSPSEYRSKNRAFQHLDDHSPENTKNAGLG